MRQPNLIFKLRSFPEKSETFIVNNIVESIKAGFNVIILCNEKKGLESSSQPELIQEYKLLEKTIQFTQPLNNDNRYIKALVLAVKPTYFLYFLRLIWLTKKFSFSYLFQLNYYGKYRKAQAIHIHFPTQQNLLYSLKRVGYLRGRIISTFHGYEIHYTSAAQHNLLKQKLKLIYNVSHDITVNTAYLYEKLTDIGGMFKNLKIIPMGIDIKYFQGSQKSLPSLPKEIKLLSIGRLVEIKGHEYAIRAVERLVASHNKVSYTIVGSGELHETLAELINELNLNNHVFLVGSKTQNEIRDMFTEHHVFLMSSVTDSTGRAESQGVVTLEAQAMGLPIVAFDSGGVKYTMEQHRTGYIVEEKNIEEFANAILRITDNQFIYKEVSKNSLEFAYNKFNVTTISKNFIKLYSS